MNLNVAQHRCFLDESTSTPVFYSSHLFPSAPDFLGGVAEAQGDRARQPLCGHKLSVDWQNSNMLFEFSQTRKLWS